MQIASKTVTTKVHHATATAEDLKGVAIGAVKRQLGLGDDVVLSSSAELQADGSITVEVVEAVSDASAPDIALSDSAGPSPALAIPVGLIAPLA